MSSLGEITRKTTYKESDWKSYMASGNESEIFSVMLDKSTYLKKSA